MHFEPHNRHLWVHPIEKEENREDPLFLMPEDYRPPKSPYVICDILGMASNCEISLDIGDRIVVDRSTIQEIKGDFDTIYVVKENYVYGRLEK